MYRALFKVHDQACYIPEGLKYFFGCLQLTAGSWSTVLFVANVRIQPSENEQLARCRIAGIILAVSR
jgi:hypothetical protein